MDFFEYLPKEYYILEDNKNSLDVVTNITNRFKINDAIKTNASSFYDYVVADGETPENLAHRFYGNSNKHWVILMMNDIVHPQFDWPMSDTSLNKFIETKYEVEANGSPVLSWTKSNTKAYYRIEKRSNPISKLARREVIEIDANTYANVITSSSNITLESGDVIVYSTEKLTESYYDYENKMNESKRKIKVLKPEYVDAVVRELEELYR
jgi:hypothetical protein